MEVYVGRQPIFDRKMNVLGYELLYRRSINNFYEGTDDSQSTAALINNAFFAMELYELTSGTRAFINFSKEMILGEIPLLLPKEKIVVEILERAETSDKLINACKKLREKGYIIALDDFVFNEIDLPLIEIAHIIKVEFNNVDYSRQHQLIKQYKNSVKFLAEKVETREEYELALNMGYDYFQGYFFGKPMVMKGREIDGLNTTLMRVLSELNQQEPEYQKITEIIETDLGLSYKMLKGANSIFFESKKQTYFIKHTLIRLGLVEVKKWVYLMMLKDIQVVENKELIRNCLIRGKLMELLSSEKGTKNKPIEYFLTGMFSSIDVLLNRSMNEIVEELPLSIDVKEALLGGNNEIRQSLHIVLNCEMLNWSITDIKRVFPNITQKKFMSMYIEALKWVLRLDY
ncbi:diguanylate phosphodiesterase [Alkaliphilus metalliredigens QYMF]|uniref:Diguanylate phosphodiesterase n=1 Tax=Alkaliphilus metalliredigens (strain QYMF) TaxID=293826 RepID=A6TSF1_ALKMQ|nr:HDOD domain-containing protein [Alkaliphilus metalliredigens]ABR49119.1 diguanylate phosphodiesterase [Alkaliphilus metalliredigens QYMF]